MSIECCGLGATHLSLRQSDILIGPLFVTVVAGIGDWSAEKQRLGGPAKLIAAIRLDGWYGGHLD